MGRIVGFSLLGKILFGSLLMTLSFIALAQGDVIVPPTGEELKALLLSIGGLKGGGSLLVVAFVVQVLCLFFRSTLAKFAGIYQLLVVNFLTLGLGVLTLKLQGVDWLACFTHSETLAAFQVLFHQAVKQFFKKKDDEATIASNS